MVSTMVIGPGSVNLSLRPACARAACASARWTGPLRRIGPTTVGPDADHRLLAEIDAVEIGEEAVDEVHAGLLAVAHDVEPGILLHLHGEDGGVELRLLEVGPRELPRRPQPFGLGEPGRLRQAADERRLQHSDPPLCRLA